jgi:hypothetical protein
MPKNMGKMPMRLMGETPMLRRMAFFNGLLASVVHGEEKETDAKPQAERQERRFFVVSA